MRASVAARARAPARRDPEAEREPASERDPVVVPAARAAGGPTNDQQQIRREHAAATRRLPRRAQPGRSSTRAAIRVTAAPTRPSSSNVARGRHTLPASSAADADHRGEVEGVRSDEHADADVVGALGQGEQRRGDLRAVGGERRQQADQRLGEPEPDAEPIEPAREARGRDSVTARQPMNSGIASTGDIASSESPSAVDDGTPTSLPGTPGSNDTPTRSRRPCR